MPLDEAENPHTPAAHATDWPAIDRSLLGEARPAPVAFPLHLLPERWRAWVEASARPFGSPDYLAHALLGGVAAVCGAGTVVQVTPQWREPLVLWQALVGGPSSGKSAAFARLRTLLDAVKPHEEGGDRFAGRVLVDFPLDQLNWPLGSSKRGALLWRADLADWMDEAGRRDERPAWLAAWNAAPAMVTRSPVECFPVGILGALAPERLAPGFVDGDSALAARFLYAWPQAEAADPSLGGNTADDEGVTAMLQKIADLAGHPETPGRISFDAAEAGRLEKVMADLERRRREFDGLEAEWIGKGVATIVRLAGLLSLMQWTQDEQPTVGEVQIEAAHELWAGYCLPQAMAVFDRAGVSGCELLARRTARWLRRVRVPEISREDVRRQALCQTVNAEGAEDVLARLEAGGMVRLVETRTPGRTRRWWTVNPALR